MTWYPDDTPCDFWGKDVAPYIRSIGWLDRAQDFETGHTSEAVCKALQALLQNPYSPFKAPGIHICNLCQYLGETGTRILLIPGNGVLYFCPELIVHYINAHWYKPPEIFCQALLKCPPPDSMAYKKSLLENGGRKLFKNKVISW